MYNTLIIGSGNIGANYDNPYNDNILTHAHAFSKHKEFKLIGFVDKKINKAQKAAKLWNGEAFKNIKDAFDKFQIDVICNATPNCKHYHILKEVSNYNIKHVFTEKPLTESLDQAKEIISIYKKKNISLNVNYSRRFVPEFEHLKRQILNCDFGKYIGGNAYYGKGILHNGSHLINFILYLFGEIQSFEVKNYFYDYFENDPSISFLLILDENKPLFVNAINCNNYTIFEFDFLFEKARIQIINGGFSIKYYTIVESEVFKGYKNLKSHKVQPTALDKALFNSAENIYRKLSFNEPLISDADEACETLRFCYNIYSNAIQNK